MTERVVRDTEASEIVVTPTPLRSALVGTGFSDTAGAPASGAPPAPPRTAVVVERLEPDDTAALPPVTVVCRESEPEDTADPWLAVEDVRVVTVPVPLAAPPAMAVLLETDPRFALALDLLLDDEAAEAD